LFSYKTIKSKKSEFNEKWLTYYNSRLENNQDKNCLVGKGNYNVWYKNFDHSTKRQYFEIDNYKIKIPGEFEKSKPDSQEENVL
jgi:hypothetical protein